MSFNPVSILISCSLSSIGGNETHILSLCNLLISNGHDVTLATRSNDFTHEYRTELYDMGVKTVTTPFRYSSSGILKNLWATLFWFRLPSISKFTHLIAIGPGGFHRLLKRCVQQNGLAMYWEAGDGLYCRMPQQNKMLRSMNKIAATSISVAKIMNKELGIPIDVLPPLSSISCTGCMLYKGKAENDEIRVSFLGRVSKLKGVDILIELWPKLSIGPSRLDIYGGGEELPEMIERTRQKGLTHSIYFHGFFDRKELASIFSKTDLVILPSLSEGVPHVLIESMAYGVPFVATNVGGVGDLATDNSDVLVVEPVTSEIALGIEIMVSRIRKQAISNDRLMDYYHKNFSIEVVGEKWLKFLGLNKLPSAEIRRC